MTPPRSYAFETCLVDPAARELRRNGVRRPVPPRVFDLLSYLLEHRSRVVTKDELLAQVWRGAFLSDGAIANAVMKARHVIGDSAGAPRLIRTAHRVGYRFIGPVTEHETRGAAMGSPVPGVVAAAAIDAPRPADLPGLTGAAGVDDELLREALAHGDRRRAAEIHWLMSKAASEFDDPDGRWQHHVREALRLAGPDRTEDWALAIYNAGGLAAIERGEHDAARLLLDHVVAATDRVGNRLQHLYALSNQALLEAIQGNLRTARGLSERALRGYEALGRHDKCLVERANLFETCAALGLLDDGLRHGDAVLGLLAHQTPTHDRLGLLWTLCVGFAQARRLDRVEQAIGWLEQCAGRPGALDAAASRIAAAQRHVCRAEFDAASVLMREAIDLALAHGRILDAQQWAPLLLHNEMRAGRHAEAGRAALALLAEPVLQATADLNGLRLHARALELHAEGDADAARVSLNEALASLQPGRWNVLARLDAAWLDMERGDVAAAQRVLIGTYSWLEAHPTGCLVDARLQLARGRHAAALESLQRSAGFFSVEPGFISAFTLACVDAVATPRVLPASTRLPSTL